MGQENASCPFFKEYYMILKALTGFLMALADSVPGVSGGTIAFLMGVYDEFIDSLHNIFSKDKARRMGALKFLLKLGCGWIIGLLLAVLVLTRFFESNIHQVSSLFLGFILFSLPVFVKEEKDSFKGKYFNLVFTLLGGALVALVTYFNISSGGVLADTQNLNLQNIAYIFLVGMLAISAMVLPGISGSSILMIFGLYMPIMTAVRNVLHFELSAVPVCVIFGLGIIAGVVVTIKAIRFCLKRFRSQTLYTVMGMMIGSVYSIIVGPLTLEPKQDMLSASNFSILFFLIGGAVIVGLQVLKRVLEKNKR